MKRKTLLLTMSLVVLSAGLVGCGKDKVENVVVEEVPIVDETVSDNDVIDNEVPSDEIVAEGEENNEEVVVEENVYGVDTFDDGTLKVELVDGVLQVTTNSTEYNWIHDEVDESWLKVEKLEKEETDALDVYTLTPMVDGPAFIGFTGTSMEDETNSFVYYVDLLSNPEEGITFMVTPPTVDDTIIEEDILPIVADETLSSKIAAVEEKVKETVGEDNMFMVAVRDVDLTNADDMSYVLGVSELEGLQKGVVSEPMMSSIAYSLVVLEFDTNENATLACETLETNAPIGKWVCVEPETVVTKVVEDKYVYFFMGPVSIGDIVEEI